jgi:hypothetical protein
MSTIKVNIPHPGDHEPNPETFKEDLSAGITKALREAGLKRGEGDYKITGYVQTSGTGTVYDVELPTEPSAAAEKATGDSKASGGKVDKA